MLHHSSTPIDWTKRRTNPSIPPMLRLRMSNVNGNFNWANVKSIKMTTPAIIDEQSKSSPGSSPKIRGPIEWEQSLYTHFCFAHFIISFFIFSINRFLEVKSQCPWIFLKIAPGSFFYFAAPASLLHVRLTFSSASGQEGGRIKDLFAVSQTLGGVRKDFRHQKLNQKHRGWPHNHGIVFTLERIPDWGKPAPIKHQSSSL